MPKEVHAARRSGRPSACSRGCWSTSARPVGPGLGRGPPAWRAVPARALAPPAQDDRRADRPGMASVLVPDPLALRRLPASTTSEPSATPRTSALPRRSSCCARSGNPTARGCWRTPIPAAPFRHGGRRRTPEPVEHLRALRGTEVVRTGTSLSRGATLHETDDPPPPGQRSAAPGSPLSLPACTRCSTPRPARRPAGQGVALGSLLGSGAEDSVGDTERLGSGAEDSVADAEPLGSVDASDVGPAVAVVGAADDPGAVPVGVGGWVRLSVGDGESRGAPGVTVAVPGPVGGAVLLAAGAGVPTSLTSSLTWSWKASSRLRTWSSGTCWTDAAEGRDLLPEGIQPPVLVGVEVTGHGEDELLGQRVGDAPGAGVVDRPREVLGDRHVGLADDEDDLEGHGHGRAARAAGEGVGLVAVGHAAAVGPDHGERDVVHRRPVRGVDRERLVVTRSGRPGTVEREDPRRAGRRRAAASSALGDQDERELGMAPGRRRRRRGPHRAWCVDDLSVPQLGTDDARRLEPVDDRAALEGLDRPVPVGVGPPGPGQARDQGTATRTATARRPGLPWVARHTEAVMLRTSRTRVSKDPSTGSETATIASILTATPATSPPAQSTVSACAWFPRLAHAVASTRGSARTMSTSVNSSSGTIDQHPARDDRPRPRLERRGPRVVPATREQAAQGGPDPRGRGRARR